MGSREEERRETLLLGIRLQLTLFSYFFGKATHIRPHYHTHLIPRHVLSLGRFCNFSAATTKLKVHRQAVARESHKRSRT